MNHLKNAEKLDLGSFVSFNRAQRTLKLCIASRQSILFEKIMSYPDERHEKFAPATA
jgi:hypothetical protein